MSEYIEREAAIAMYEDDEIDMGALKVPVPVIVQNLKDVPAADVRPVVHGKWERLDMHKGMEQFRCSICRSECYVPTCMGEPMYEFCPNCGALMDKDGDGDV